MTSSATESIEEFAAAALRGGVSTTICDALVALRPPGDLLAPRMEMLIPESTLPGRCAIITVAIELADDRRYRPVVERLLEEPSDVAEKYPITIFDSGATLRSEALGWWFETLASRPRWRYEADRLIHTLTGPVLDQCRDAAIAHLTVPGRRPRILGVWAAADVLCALGRIPAVEATWLQWIRDEQFTNRLDHRGPHTPENGTKSDLDGALRQCLEAGVLTHQDELVRAASATA
ncbi:hypothetical protein LQ327_22590 [Actinomycetospora endophytica]|uniref:3-methyladenine DNA glycosylase AlkD n=1 Tax=Actinomycetospora endophytica TaxID=2291215 RepID=A0ABS8PD09_9PSEU|nr:hypothetical protein [Actinomycetospora endophytica]MCD2196165.1 hypothetical protein [Actinomycetospora endophytica]